MKELGSGCVVNIAAESAFESAHSVYGLAKAGVVHLTRQLAIELAPEVRVNCLAPGLIADNEGMDPAKAGEVVEGTPLGRLVSRGPKSPRPSTCYAAPPSKASPARPS